MYYVVPLQIRGPPLGEPLSKGEIITPTWPRGNWRFDHCPGNRRQTHTLHCFCIILQGLPVLKSLSHLFRSLPPETGPHNLHRPLKDTRDQRARAAVICSPLDPQGLDCSTAHHCLNSHVVAPITSFASRNSRLHFEMQIKRKPWAFISTQYMWAQREPSGTLGGEGVSHQTKISQVAVSPVI